MYLVDNVSRISTYFTFVLVFHHCTYHSYKFDLIFVFIYIAFSPNGAKFEQQYLVHKHMMNHYKLIDRAKCKFLFFSFSYFKKLVYFKDFFYIFFKFYHQDNFLPSSTHFGLLYKGNIFILGQK